MSWKQLLAARKVHTHQTSKQELDELRAVIRRDLSDAAIPALSEDRRLVFLYRSELQLTPKGSTSMHLEVDLCCVVDGKLCIGEAKSNGSLKSDKLDAQQIAERYRDLALKMGATLVVFSTVEDSWDKVSREAMEVTFQKHPHIELLRWTSATLYGRNGVI